jgi:uncharacterized RDD family membrane protein YckC
LPTALDEYRAQYAHSSNHDLQALLQTDPERLTPDALRALVDEASRRGLQPPVASARTISGAPRLSYMYPKAPLGPRLAAYIVDGIIGAGPVITAAVFDFLFHVAQSPLSRTINMAATVTWAIYYGATKDARGNGQSIGKKMNDLMVVGTETNEPCTLLQSAQRAFVGLIFGVIPVVGQLIEPIAVFATNDGRRIGDRAANTQVIRVSDYEPQRQQRLMKSGRDAGRPVIRPVEAR